MLLKNTSLTIKQALNQAYLKLKRFQIKEAFLDAQILLAFVLKKNRSYILAHNEKILTIKQLEKYQILIKKRAHYWPIAYLTSHKEFYELNFKINKNTLVPRPASELIVEEALPLINKNTTLIDLGTGSGCLIISVLKNLKIKPKIAIAIDISSAALKIAKANAKKYKLNNIKFKKNDLLKNIKLPKDNIVIMANLPYLTTKQMIESSIKHEPKQALVAGPDGLKYYRELAKQLKKYQVKNMTLLCEINPEQKKEFKKIFPKVRFRKDLNKKIRIGIVT